MIPDALLSPSDWAESVDPKWVHTRHHLLINDAIVDLVDGYLGVPILIVELPVRHGKSEFLSHHAMAWHTMRFPGYQRLLMSASDRLATKWGRKTKRTVQEFGQAYGVQLSGDKESASEWETTEGGGMLTAGIGGDIMGRDLNFGAIDDFLKNSEAALSPTIREKQWDAFQSTMFARLEPGGAIVVFGTRWHGDDLIGCITGTAQINTEALPHYRIRLPAICDSDDDPLGREIGEALWPERWPIGHPEEMVTNAWGQQTVGLAMRKRTTDAYWWDAIYQQRPTSHGKTIWPDHYFDGILTDDWPGTFELSAMAVDPADGKPKGSDGAVVKAGLSGGKVWFDAEFARESADKSVSRALDWIELERIDIVGCETIKHGNLPIIEWNRQIVERNIVPIPLHEINDNTPKPTRIMRWGGLLANNVVRVRNTPGGRQLVRQLKDFGSTDRLDIADAGEMAFRLLGRMSKSTLASTPEAESVYY